MKKILTLSLLLTVTALTHLISYSIEPTATLPIKFETNGYYIISEINYNIREPEMLRPGYKEHSDKRIPNLFSYGRPTNFIQSDGTLNVEMYTDRKFHFSVFKITPIGFEQGATLEVVNEVTLNDSDIAAAQSNRILVIDGPRSYYWKDKPNSVINPNEVDKDGNTPLHRAAPLRQDLPFIKKVLAANVPINAQNKRGETALYLALEKGSNEVVRLLLEHNADATIKDNNGNTTLHAAVKGDKADLMSELIKKGVDINAKNNNGETALYTAVAMQIGNQSNRSNAISMLLKLKANPNIKTKNGDTVFLIAVKADNIATVKELAKAKGLDLNVRDKDGNTALHIAAAREVFRVSDMAKLLKEMGADLTIKDKKGKMAYELAKFVETRKLLKPRK